MIKRDELSNPESCLNQAADDEPLFVLKANDPIAAETVRWWLHRSIQRRIHLTRLSEGAQTAGLMDDWRMARRPRLPMSEAVRTASEFKGPDIIAGRPDAGGFLEQEICAKCGGSKRDRHCDLHDPPHCSPMTCAESREKKWTPPKLALCEICHQPAAGHCPGTC